MFKSEKCLSLFTAFLFYLWIATIVLVNCHKYKGRTEWYNNFTSIPPLVRIGVFLVGDSRCTKCNHSSGNLTQWPQSCTLCFKVFPNLLGFLPGCFECKQYNKLCISCRKSLCTTVSLYLDFQSKYLNITSHQRLQWILRRKYLHLTFWLQKPLVCFMFNNHFKKITALNIWSFFANEIHKIHQLIHFKFN